MCIRDSRKGVFHPPQQTPGARFHWSDIVIDLVDGDGFIPRDLKTVSYTHLRAHETVLDLVCRLLLEKKKYN